jgi:hypothetical protein
MLRNVLKEKDFPTRVGCAPRQPDVRRLRACASRESGEDGQGVPAAGRGGGRQFGVFPVNLPDGEALEHLF